jgi:PadR family transcriptional regulator PadR
MTEKDTQKAIKNFEAQFKKATLPLIILSMLNERDMYAYEIMQETEKRSDGKYKMPLLYVAINKLQEQGFVKESHKEVTKDNRIRIYYKITEEGREHRLLLRDLFRELSDTVNNIVADGPEK